MTTLDYARLTKTTQLHLRQDYTTQGSTFYRKTRLGKP